MIKRLSTAAIAVAFASLATTALAGPYFGYDGRHYGEFATAPDFARPGKVAAKQEEHHVKGSGDRHGLTKPMLALLQTIEDKFGPVNVISGYRPGARIATSGRVSRHASGNAVDIDAGSRKAAIVKWLIATHKNGGTMTYSDMSHIHVDIGPHFVALGSWSGTTGGRSHSYGGRAARYASDYDRGWRRGRQYARYSEERGSSRYYGERGGSRYHSYGGGRSRYASGYATIYN
jgi:hypothetical protein